MVWNLRSEESLPNYVCNTPKAGCTPSSVTANARHRTFICDIYRCRKLLAIAEAACDLVHYHRPARNTPERKGKLQFKTPDTVASVQHC